MVIRSSNPRVPNRTLQVVVRSISCEGAGVLLPGPGCVIERLTTVTLRFKLAGDDFELPGLVVWQATPSANHRPPVDVGIRFQLAALASDARLAYAHRVVGFLRARGR